MLFFMRENVSGTAFCGYQVRSWWKEQYIIYEKNSGYAVRGTALPEKAL